MMLKGPFTVAGFEFTARRYHKPVPHWRLGFPDGHEWTPGTAGLDGQSYPKIKTSLEELADRIGVDRFREETEEDMEKRRV